jgi:hypothetical protein
MFLIGNFTKKNTEKTRNKMGGRRPEGHITDPRTTRMEKTSIKRRRREASGPRSQGPGPRAQGCNSIGGWTDHSPGVSAGRCS